MLETALSRAARAAGRVPVLGPRMRSAYYALVRRSRSSAVVTRRNTRRAYERLYRSDALLADYLSPERIRFYEEVADRAARIGPSRVVDVGCGSGDLLAALDRRLHGSRVMVGVDYAAAGVARARAKLPEGRFTICDLFRLDECELLAGEKFDLVLCTEVLEHMSDATAALVKIASLRGENGVLLLTVPDGDVDSWEGHVNFWNEAEFASFLAEVGPPSIEKIDEGRVLLAQVPRANEGHSLPARGDEGS